MYIHNPKNGAIIDNPSLGKVFMPGDTIDVPDFLGLRMLSTYGFLVKVDNMPEEEAEEVEEVKKTRKKGKKKNVTV